MTGAREAARRDPRPSGDRHDRQHPRRHRRAPVAVSVVLPCFDEAQNVAAADPARREAAARVARDHEVIVVDDGSATTRARSPRRSRRATAGAGRRPRRNRGYGAAVRSGIAASRCDWVLLTDGDLQFDLAEIELILPLAPTTTWSPATGSTAPTRPAPRAAHAWNG